MSNEKNESELVSADQIKELFEGTMGRPTSIIDTLTIFNSGKEDYFNRGEEKVESIVGVLLYSQRPMRTFWKDPEISGKQPDCFSLDGIRPSGEANEPQADACADCPMDKFKTAHKGFGKACKTRAADFVLEVSSFELALPPITKTAMPVFKLDPSKILGPALVRYGIGNREASDNYASIVRFARERGTYIQALLCRWGFVKGQSKSGTKYDVVMVEPLAKLDEESFTKVVVPMVRTLKGGQALEVLTQLGGTKEEHATE